MEKVKMCRDTRCGGFPEAESKLGYLPHGSVPKQIFSTRPESSTNPELDSSLSHSSVIDCLNQQPAGGQGEPDDERTLFQRTRFRN